MPVITLSTVCERIIINSMSMIEGQKRGDSGIRDLFVHNEWGKMILNTHHFSGDISYQNHKSILEQCLQRYEGEESVYEKYAYQRDLFNFNMELVGEDKNLIYVPRSESPHRFYQING